MANISDRAFAVIQYFLKKSDNEDLEKIMKMIHIEFVVRGLEKNKKGVKNGRRD